MDESIRDLRARRWQSADRGDTGDGGQNDAAESSSVEPQRAKLFDFGASSIPQDAQYEELKEESSSGPRSIVGNEDHGDHSESDEEAMKRQLGKRESAPYSFVPPSRKESVNIKPEPSEPIPRFSGSYPDEHAAHTHRPTRTTSHETTPEETSEPWQTDERTCRICFSPASPDEKLISPCKCRGTSKWIHISCLNQWRMHSQNSKSYYRCDQCHYQYSFRRTDLANFLLSKWTLLALTVLAFTFASFVGGFVIKFGLFLVPPEYLMGPTSWLANFSFFYTPIDAGQDMLSAASALVPNTPRRWQEIFIVDVWHFVQGIISLGMLGTVGLVGTGGLFSLRTFGRPRARRRGDGLGVSDLVFIAVILLGCGKVAMTMWDRVRTFVKKRLAASAERILEVDPE